LGTFVAWLFARIPRSTAVLNLIGVVLFCGFISVALFSRGLFAVLLSSVGALSSLSVAGGAVERRTLRVFGAVQLLVSGLSILLAALTLSNVARSCVAAQNPTQCEDVSVVVAVVLAAGSATLGLFAALSACLAFLASKAPGEEHAQALELISPTLAPKLPRNLPRAIAAGSIGW
jgi:hypothetical protein